MTIADFCLTGQPFKLAEKGKATYVTSRPKNLWPMRTDGLINRVVISSTKEQSSRWGATFFPTKWLPLETPAWPA